MSNPAMAKTSRQTGETADPEGARFEFGRNWAQFLELLDESRIEHAVESLADMLGTRELNGKGSALDRKYLGSLGLFDVVYSWGVLHHTGDMWGALENAHRLVKADGLLVLALYNDAGGRSVLWKGIKRAYLALPVPLRPAFAGLTILPGELRMLASAVAKGRPMEYVELWTKYAEKKRGMNRWRDVIDWVGGYPYEYSRSDKVFDFYRERGFVMRRFRCSAGSLGCNEFVFQKW